MTTSKRAGLSLVLVAVCALAGCDREPAVSQTKQPKDTSTAVLPQAQPAQNNPQLPPDHPPVQPGAQMPGMDQVASGPVMSWTAPTSWRLDKTPRPMREATFLIGEGEKSAELVITRLGGQFGEFSANVNRWRGQVGAEPLADAGSVPARDVKSPAGDLKVYEMEGPAKKMLVGILNQGDVNWFFKLAGDKGIVSENAQAFDQFLQSLRTVNETAGDK